jgi:SSS family solute:Na+ symporter
VLGAKDARHAQLGTICAAFLKILTPFLFLLPGILCFVLHKGIDSEKAFATMVVNLLPPGMVGLMVAVLVAALISTIDSGLNSFSTVFALDIYKTSIRPQASPLETKTVGRLATLFAAVAAVGFALLVDKFVDQELFAMIQSVIGFIAPPVSAVFIVGVLWRRATSTAAVLALVLGFIVSISVGICSLTDYPNKEFWPHFLLLSFYLFAGICVFMIVVSLLTREAPDVEGLPTLRSANATQKSGQRLVWMLWGILAVCMGLLYWVFN